MNEDEIKNRMIVRVKTISEFCSEDEYDEYKGKLTTIIKSEYCSACNRKHYDILFTDGTKIIDEFSADNFIKANQEIRK